MEPDTALPQGKEATLAALVKADTREPSEILAGKLRLALALFHDGVRMKRASLERGFPDASEWEIDEKLRAWLRHRPGERPGVPAAWPRR